MTIFGSNIYIILRPFFQFSDKDIFRTIKRSFYADENEEILFCNPKITLVANEFKWSMKLGQRV
jgi:hypothetical protein